MDVVADSASSPRVRALHGWAIASMVANAALIITGGVVRLTHSGLGCPTWPKCQDSYLPDSVLGVHGLIEFGNRLLTFVLIAIALVTFVMALRIRGPLRRPAATAAFIIGIGIIGQGVVGGFTVLLKLNPWMVSAHLYLSLILVAIATWLVHLTSRTPADPVRGRPRVVALAAVAVSYVVMFLGTIVTGSGPNSGDDGARRNGLDLLATARTHAFAVWLLLLLTAVAIWLLRGRRAGRMAVGLLVVECVMGIIGYAQYFSGLPFGLVIAHMTGVALFAIAVGHLWFAVMPPRLQGYDGSSARGATAARASQPA